MTSVGRTELTNKPVLYCMSECEQNLEDHPEYSRVTHISQPAEDIGYRALNPWHQPGRTRANSRRATNAIRGDRAYTLRLPYSQTFRGDGWKKTNRASPQ